jgi:hypothetical protein
MDRSKTERLEMARAAARERLLGAYVRQGEELVRIVGDRLPASRALEIYVRLQELDDPTGREVCTRALAALADRWLGEGQQIEASAPEESDELLGPGQRLKAFLNRRHDPDLRVCFELHAARTKAVVMSVHIGNAVELAERFGSYDTLVQCVDDYVDALGVPADLMGGVTVLALERLGREHLRGVWGPPSLAAGLLSRSVETVESEEPEVTPGTLPPGSAFS